MHDPGIIAASRAHAVFAGFDRAALERFAFAVLYAHTPVRRGGRYRCRLCGVPMRECAVDRAADAFLGPRPRAADP